MKKNEVTQDDNISSVVERNKFKYDNKIHNNTYDILDSNNHFFDNNLKNNENDNLKMNEKLQLGICSYNVNTNQPLNYNTFVNKNCNSNDTREENQNSHNKSTLDSYLDSIGYNRFQLFIFFIVCFVFFVDGSEMIIINLILSSIQRDWKITTFERSMLSSAVFFGFFIGSFVSGYLTNKYGRKKPSILGICLIWIFTTLTPYINGFFVLFSIRFFVGIGIGFVVPALTSLVTELIPTFYRSFVLNMLWIFYPLGIIYICFISIFYIKDKEFLDWKRITLINSYSSLIMLILSFYLCESPRYMLLKRNYEEAFILLDKIGKSKNIKLSQDEKERIILEYQLLEETNKLKNQSSTGNFNIKIFVEKNYLKVSLLLSYLWFISSLISYGLLYILPKLFDSLSKHDKYNSLIHMIYSMLILTPCPFFRGVISEVKSLGRKNSMIIGFTGAGIACIFCISNQSYISLSSGFLKFFVNSSLGIVSVYTSEIYPTNIRSIALGFGNSITRLGGILTPFICEIVENIIPKGPFWLFILGAFTGIISCFALPYETMGMALDKAPMNNEGKNKQESMINTHENCSEEKMDLKKNIYSENKVDNYRRI